MKIIRISAIGKWSVPGNYPVGLRKVTVTISWLDGSGKQSRAIVTYIAKRGPQD